MPRGETGGPHGRPCLEEEGVRGHMDVPRDWEGVWSHMDAPLEETDSVTRMPR